LVEIRKYGFTLVTGLLTTNSYLFVKVEELTPWQMSGISLIIIVLIIGLYVLDRYYLVLLRSTAIRAIDIEKVITKREKKLNDKEFQMKLSTQIHKDVVRVGAQILILILYCLFIVVSFVPSLIAFFTYDFSTVAEKNNFLIMWTVILVGSIVSIIAYNIIIRYRFKLQIS
jgi:membrane protein DedA with SNARE-associated domain